MTFRPLGKPLKQLGQFMKGPGKPFMTVSRQLKFRATSGIYYAAIEKQVQEAIDRLEPRQRWQISPSATLPEKIVAPALIALGLLFQSYLNEDGGRMRLGGAVIDFKVWQGARPIIIRVQGDYWHSMPERKLKDAAQWARLHALGYRVTDLWEQDIYRAWVERRSKELVEDAISRAA